MATQRRVVGLIALTALLAGCVVGPNYRTPSPPAGAAGPLVSLDRQVESPLGAPDAWWRLYKDRRLDFLLAEAFIANADLATAEAHLSSARAVLEATRANRYPKTTADAGGVYGRDANTDEILEIGGHPPQTLWLFDDVLDVSYELDLFGRIRRMIEASRADAEAAAAARDGLRITVAAETTRAYAQICTFGEQLAVAQRSLDIVSHEAKIAQDRYEAGANSRFDVVRAEGLAAQARTAIAPLEGQRRAALFELTALLGRSPAEAPSDVLSCVTPPRLTGSMPVGDGAGLLKRRPDIRQTERKLAGATARIGVATADLYPRIRLGALYGGASSEITALGSENALTWGVGPSVSWSFPNQAEPRARVRQAKAGAAAAMGEFDSAVLRALKEVEQALTIYGAELDRHRALLDAQDKTHEAYAIAHGETQAGAISTLDLLSTEQVLVETDAAVAASDSALVQDQIGIFKALGGGWSASDALAHRH